jgi:hypothetical protein
MDGRVAMHVAGRPHLPVSTDSRARYTLVNRLRSIVVRSPPEPTQSVNAQPLCLFDLWFGPMWSTCHKHSCSDTVFGGIPNVLVVFEML